MYGVFPYIYHKKQSNVGKYTIHGWYGPFPLGSMYVRNEPGISLKNPMTWGWDFSTISREGSLDS